MTAGMVIVGAGEAGVNTAVCLRQKGYDGPVTLLGAEPQSPYERPPLSKSVMLGEPVAPIGNVGRLKELGVDLRLGQAAVGIDPKYRLIALLDGSYLAYDRLLLATGARARRLSLPGGELAITLRTLDDANAIRARLTPGKRLVVIGGGFIGLELAASARSLGVAVIVLEAQSRLLMRGVPAVIAELISEQHRSHGVDIRTSVTLSGLVAEGASTSVILGSGERIAADLVVAGIGAEPDTHLAASAGLKLENGIAVNSSLQTSDPDIFAAGDCCSFPHPLYDGRRIRLESWRNAVAQGEAAAAAMLGEPLTYSAVPWFWSDQYDLTLQIAGLADGAAVTVARDQGDGSLILFHLAADGRLLAASGYGVIGRIARDIRVAEFLIAARAAPDPKLLVASDVKLKSLLSS